MYSLNVSNVTNTQKNLMSKLYFMDEVANSRLLKYYYVYDNIIAKYFAYVSYDAHHK